MASYETEALWKPFSWWFTLTYIFLLSKIKHFYDTPTNFIWNGIKRNVNIYTSTESQLSSHSYGSFRTAITVISGVISVNGMFGNILMILICCLNKMGSTQNSFLANLTVGNFINLVWCLPIWVLSSHIFWPLGELACKHIYIL